MSADATAALNALHENLNALFVEFDKAVADGETEREAGIREELRETADAIARIEIVANAGVAANLDAIADALEERVEAQQALGFATLLNGLTTALKRIRPSSDVLEDAIDKPALVVASDVADSKREIVAAIIEQAQAKGFPALTVLSIVAIESDFRPNARNPLSSAGGLFQFTDTRWDEFGGNTAATGGGRGNGHASHASVAEQIDVGMKHLLSLKAGLEQDHMPVTAAKVYMAHQQGPTGARKILEASPIAAIEDIIGQTAASNNLLSGLTVRQTIKRFRDTVAAHIDEVRSLVDTNDTAATTPPAAATGETRLAANRAPSVALSEMHTFARQGQDKIPEGSDPLHARGLQYFAFVKAERNTIVGAANAWSAAFISFVYGKAGLSGSVFPFAPNHARYILKALANSDKIKSNAAVSQDEQALTYHEIDEKAPRVGDLVGYGSSTRNSELLGRPVRSTEDIRRHLPKRHFPSHTDLVVDVQPGKLTVIGGNVGDTIDTKTYALGPDGKLAAGQRPFFVLRVDA